MSSRFEKSSAIFKQASLLFKKKEKTGSKSELKLHKDCFEHYGNWKIKPFSLIWLNTIRRDAETNNTLNASDA